MKEDTQFAMSSAFIEIAEIVVDRANELLMNVAIASPYKGARQQEVVDMSARLETIALKIQRLRKDMYNFNNKRKV